MSEDVPIGLTITEKLVGLILIILGAISVYFFNNAPAGDISYFAGLFTTAGFVVIAAGLILLVAKTE